MSSEATTLPLREQPAAGPRARLSRTLRLGRSGAGAVAGRRTAVIALASIVALVLLDVLMAANRPSVLAPTTHVAFYPHWMAGPLGGLWPWLTGNSRTLKWMFSGSMAIMYIAYVVVLRRTRALEARWVIASIVVVHGILILSPPLALTDLFNYINYGRMEVVHHLNPYTTIPILEPHSDPSFTLSNWHELLSPYGPLFTMLTFAVVPLGVAGSFWALKVLLILTSLGILTLVWRSARLLGRDPVFAIALVGLNPIVLVWGLGGDHNDFLMVFFIMLAFYLLLVAREQERERTQTGRLRELLDPLSPALLGAGAAFVVATGLKASAGVLIPVVLAGLLNHRRAFVQALLGMVAAGAVVGAMSLIAFGLHIPDLSTQARLVTQESIPNLVGLALGKGGASEGVQHLMTGVLAASLLACCWAAWRGPRSWRERGAAERTITASGWASVALLVTLGWVLPWYVLWVLPLAALSVSRRLRVVALVLGAYLVLVWAPVSGIIFGAVGFHPEKTALGRLHQRYVRELLN
jgi:alpha-1,6-mannosyltransferase